MPRPHRLQRDENVDDHFKRKVAGGKQTNKQTNKQRINKTGKLQRPKGGMDEPLPFVVKL